MNKEEVLRGILGEWRRLPESERRTEDQCAAFAMKMANDPNYSFRCRGDRYQEIMGYMRYNISGLRKVGP